MLTKEEVIQLCEGIYKGDSEGMVKVYENAIEEAEDRKDKRQAQLFKETLKCIKEVYSESGDKYLKYTSL